MGVFRMAIGGSVGLVVGAALGFGLALVAASFRPSPMDGTYGMREILVGLPLGAALGFAAGLVWGR